MFLITIPCFSQQWSTLPVDVVVGMNTSTAGTALTSTIGNAGTTSSTCTVGTSCFWGTPMTGFTVGANQGIFTNLGAVHLNSGTTYPAGTLNYNNIAHNDADNNTTLQFSFSSGITNVTEGMSMTLGFPDSLSGSDWDLSVLFDSSGNFAATQINNYCFGSALSMTGVRVESKGPSGVIIHSPCIPITNQGSYYFSTNYNLVSGAGLFANYVSGGTISGSAQQTCNVTFSTGGGGMATAVLSASNTIGEFNGVPTTTWSSAPTTATLSNGTATCSGTITITSTVMGLATLYVFTPGGTPIGSPVAVAEPSGNTLNDVIIGNNESGNNSGTTTYFQNIMFDWTNHANPLMWTNTLQWNGIIAPQRAVNWKNAGVVGGIPDAAWSQCVTTACNTVVTGPASSITAAQINAAIASASANTYVSIPAGTYSLTGPINYAGKSNVVLRGAGATQTTIATTSGSGCLGAAASICITSADNNYKSAMSNEVSWTNGYAQGSTSLTLTSVPNLVIGNPIILDQLDSTSDNGGVLVSQSTTTGTGISPGSAGPYAVSGNTGGSGICANPTSPVGCYEQQQIVMVTGCNGSTTVGTACSGTNTIVTISPAIYMPNWSAANSPRAWWSTSPATNDGVENMTIDSTNCTGCIGIEFFNASNSWTKGIRSIQPSRAHVQIQYGNHITNRDSYDFMTQGIGVASYGQESYSGSDNLTENNVYQAVTTPHLCNGPCSGSVFDYNYSINGFYTSSVDYNIPAHGDHTAGVDTALNEGNVQNGMTADAIHGTSNLVTYFRNYFTGTQPVCWASSSNTSTPSLAYSTATYAACSNNRQPANLYAYHRGYNMIGNVLGTTGINTTYEGCSADTTVYYMGCGNSTVPADSNVLATTLLWGNTDSATGFSSPRFNASEVPSGLKATQTIFVNPVPASTTLPSSFLYTSTPSWWTSGKAFPPIGPDVTTGTISGVGGHVNTIPAQDCYNNMGGNVNGTSGVLTFDPTTCYTASLPPSVTPTIFRGGNVVRH